MNFYLENLDLEPDAARQYIDARTAFIELERTAKSAKQVRGGMVWKTVQGKAYLIRTSAAGQQKSLGKRSTETEAMYQRFTDQKQAVSSRLTSLKAMVSKHERMNRALRVGRVPSIAVAILNRLANAELSPYFRVVGTHALYAYEAAAGIHFASQVTTTRDIDLLWDTRKRMAFAQTREKDSPSMLAAFSEIVVAENGIMARMHTLHPAAFVQFKRWLVKQPDRDPIKRRRDALQADAVEWVLKERLPHFQM